MRELLGGFEVGTNESTWHGGFRTWGVRIDTGFGYLNTEGSREVDDRCVVPGGEMLGWKCIPALTT